MEECENCGRLEEECPCEECENCGEKENYCNCTLCDCGEANFDLGEHCEACCEEEE